MSEPCNCTDAVCPRCTHVYGADYKDYRGQPIELRATFAINGTPPFLTRFRAASRLWWLMLFGYRYVVVANLHNDRKTGKRSVKVEIICDEEKQGE